MSYCQYKFACSHCGSDLSVVSVECNPILIQCPGCNRVIVVQNGKLYTVSKEFFDGIAEKYKFVCCGQISDFIIHRRDPENALKSMRAKKEPISNEDIKALHNFLDDAWDSLEIIKKLW